MPINTDELAWQTVRKGNANYRRKQIGKAAGGEQLGVSLYELPPHGASFPYHYHTANEEALYVLDGTGTLRLDGERFSLTANDFVAFPANSSGAHRITTDDENSLRCLLISTMNEPDVMVYPDSKKVGVVAGAAPGGDKNDRVIEDFYLRSDAVGYWEGEGDLDDR